MADVEKDLQLVAAAGSSLRPGNPADDALLRLLAHMVVSDGVVHAGELGFLAKLLPHLTGEALEAWAREHGAEGIDPTELGQQITDPDMQWKCLRYVARMAWKDGELAGEERELLEALAAAMRMPAGAVDRVLSEMRPDDGTRYTQERILKALVEIRWDAVQLASGDLVSEDLIAVLPEGTEVVARVGLDRVEVLGIATTGIVARFHEGAAFLKWTDIVTYTRTFGLGASVTLHTEDGRAYTLVDTRLSGIAILLDRLLGSDEARVASGTPPKIEQVRGD